MAELYPNLVECMVVTGSDTALTPSISNGALERVGFSSWSDCLLPDTIEGVKYMSRLAAYKAHNLPNWFYKDSLEDTFDNRKEKAELLEALVAEGKDYTPTAYPQKVHLLWGENDRIWTMETARSLQKKLGDDTTLQSIDKACHLVQLERPHVYNRKLKEILASLSEDVHKQY